MAVAVVVSARGNRGEVAAILLTSRPERFASLKEVYLFGPGGFLNQPQPFAIESVWEHRGRLILKLRGVDSISEAEQLRGAEVRIPRRQRMDLAEDEYFHSDLFGCEVLERGTGERIGSVSDVVEQGGPVLLRIQGTAGEEILIPFAKAICVEIDVASRRILVDLPEGLKDLNRS